MIHPPELLTKFWDRVAIGPACWEWRGAMSSSGYGAFCLNYQQWLSHRLSFEIHVGPIPPGRLVLHHCDNRPCVRPSHLYTGTYADNARDAIQRDRFPFGERSPKARLTIEAVREIRALYPGMSQCALARRYGVHPYAVWALVNGVTWSHTK